MTARNEDPNLLEWLRNLQSRVGRLEGRAGTKQNDIRLGDWVTTVDDDGCVVTTNPKTGEQKVTCPPLPDQSWSWPGEISNSPDTIYSPAYVLSRQTQIRDIVLAFRPGFTTNAPISVVLYLNADTTAQTITLPADTGHITVEPLEALRYLVRDDRLYVSLTFADEATPQPENLALTVRFKN